MVNELCLVDIRIQVLAVSADFKASDLLQVKSPRWQVRRLVSNTEHIATDLQMKIWLVMTGTMEFGLTFHILGMECHHPN